MIKDFCEYSEYITYCNQDDDFDSLCGEWYYFDNDNLVIYHGTFGNDHSPGSKYYTSYHECDTKEEYSKLCKQWEELPEYTKEYIDRHQEENNN